MKAAEIERYISFGRSLMDEAAIIALKYFRSPVDIDNKKSGDGFDPVTRADREVEMLIRDRISSRFPEHGIIGEEFGSTNPDCPMCWIIDPIDGTRAYMTGMTGWGILVGLVADGIPKIGFMCQPYLEEVWIGTPMHARMIRHGVVTELNCSTTQSLADAVLYCTHPEMFESSANFANFEALAEQVKLMRYGGDCYAYSQLAMGLVDLVVEDGLQPYDIMPLVPLIQAAGGVVTDINGEIPSAGGLVVTAANQTLHQQALAYMRRSH